MTPQQIIQKYREENPLESIEIDEFGFLEEHVVKIAKYYAKLCCEAQKIACYKNCNIGAESLYEFEKSILETEITLL